jgi:hypothetical protein
MASARTRSSALQMSILMSCFLLLFTSVACGQDSTVTELTGPQTYGGRYAGGTATGDTDDGAAFARWVMDQDPQHRYLTGAVVRGNQTLGVKVQPTITKGDLQELLVSLAQGMARTFPGQPIHVIAFYQSGDKLAEANFDPRTGRVSVG